MDTATGGPVSRRDLQFLKNSRQCEEVLGMFSLFSNRFRFKILCLLNEGDFRVTEILAGYLSKSRQERSIYYHLKDERIKELLSFLYDLYGTGEAR